MGRAGGCAGTLLAHLVESWGWKGGKGGVGGEEKETTGSDKLKGGCLAPRLKKEPLDGGRRRAA